MDCEQTFLVMSNAHGLTYHIWDRRYDVTVIGTILFLPPLRQRLLRRRIWFEVLFWDRLDRIERAERRLAGDCGEKNTASIESGMRLSRRTLKARAGSSKLPIIICCKAAYLRWVFFGGKNKNVSGWCKKYWDKFCFQAKKNLFTTIKKKCFWGKIFLLTNSL